MSEHNETVPTAVTWNDDAILRAAGNNPASIIRLLAQYRQPVPTDMAVYQMISRGRISHVWRPRILYALLRAGRITLASVFTLASTNPPPPKEE